MKFFIFIIFIKVLLNQIFPKDNDLTKNAQDNNKENNKEIKKLEINYNKLNDTFIQIISDEQNSKDKKFILNEQTYIIYPSNNKNIEQYSSLLSIIIKNNSGINIGVTPNIAMKMTNKIKNNFIQLILENKNKENENEIVKIKINHRKILIKSKELLGIKQGLNIIEKLLLGNNLSNTTYDEIYFGPKEIILSSNVKNNKLIYFGLLISFILIIATFYFTKRNQL